MERTTRHCNFDWSDAIPERGGCNWECEPLHHKGLSANDWPRRWQGREITPMTTDLALASENYESVRREGRGGVVQTKARSVLVVVKAVMGPFATATLLMQVPMRL